MKEKENIVFGLHTLESILLKHPERLLRLSVLKDRHDQKIQSLLELANKNSIAIELLSRQELDRMTQDKNHQGIVGVCHSAKNYSEHDLEIILEKTKKPFLLILDGVQDPHNLGACLRSADAAGIDAVIAPKDKSVGLTPTVAKVASGAAENVPFIQVTNLARTLRMLKENNIWIFGASDDAEKTLYQADLTVPLAIVLGAEGTGMRRLTREHCDEVLKIPMQGIVSSLNVSVAAGIFLFEVVRQKNISH